MKRNKYVKDCGPYKVVSVSQGMRGIQMIVYPAFPKYNLSDEEREDEETDVKWIKEPRWAIQRLKLNNGGGPSIFSCIALAEELEEFLNQKYTREEVDSWKSTLDEALADYNKRENKRFEKAMARLEKRSKND